jgi:HEAT repeat protein
LKDLLYIDFRDEIIYSKSLNKLVESIQKLYSIRATIIELLEGDEEVRSQAAQKLALLKNRFTIPIIEHRLLLDPVEPDPIVRGWLAHALGEIDDESAYITLRKADEHETVLWTKQCITEALFMYDRRSHHGKGESISDTQ